MTDRARALAQTFLALYLGPDWWANETDLERAQAITAMRTALEQHQEEQ